MSDQVIKIREKDRGRRGGEYWYVCENNTLVHVSRYATRSAEVDKSRRGPTKEYEVPVEKIHRKMTYQFDFTNSGYLDPMVCGVDAFLNTKDPAHPWVPNHGYMRHVRDSELLELSFEIDNPSLKQDLKELETSYAPMIDETKRYEMTVGFEIFFMGAQGTADIYRDWRIGSKSCLAIPNDKSRLKSLKLPLRWIHQLWIMMLACDALGMKGIRGKNEWQKKSWWRIEQGSQHPAFVMDGETDTFTFWFEFQPDRMAHLLGFFKSLAERGWPDKGIPNRREPIRPDVVICRGEFSDAEELKPKGLDLIIECKNEDFQNWQDEIEKQILPYRERFEPYSFILASMKQMPDYIKQRLRSFEIKVVDDLYPGNENAIKEFKEFILGQLT